MGTSKLNAGSNLAMSTHPWVGEEKDSLIVIPWSKETGADGSIGSHADLTLPFITCEELLLFKTNHPGDLKLYIFFVLFCYNFSKGIFCNKPILFLSVKTKVVRILLGVDSRPLQNFLSCNLCSSLGKFFLSVLYHSTY